MWGNFRENGKLKMENGEFINFSDIVGEIFLILLFLGIAIGVIIAAKVKK